MCVSGQVHAADSYLLRSTYDHYTTAAWGFPDNQTMPQSGSTQQDTGVEVTRCAVSGPARQHRLSSSGR